jgi:hypothetical protein
MHSLFRIIKSHCLQALEVVRANQGKIEISEQEYDNLKKAGKNDEEIAKVLKVSTKTLQRRKHEWTT